MYKHNWIPNISGNLNRGDEPTASNVEMWYMPEPLKCVKKTELWHTFGCVALWAKEAEILSSYFMFSLICWEGVLCVLCVWCKSISTEIVIEIKTTDTHTHTFEKKYRPKILPYYAHIPFFVPFPLSPPITYSSNVTKKKKNHDK